MSPIGEQKNRGTGEQTANPMAMKGIGEQAKTPKKAAKKTPIKRAKKAAKKKKR